MSVDGTISRRAALRLAGGMGLTPILGNLHPAPASSADHHGQGAFSEPLRTLDKPGLTVGAEVTIEGPRHRVVFYRATWDGGQTYLRDLFVRQEGQWLRVNDPDRRFDEQWVVFVADEANPADYYTSATPQWVGFDELRRLDTTTVELRNAASEHELAVQWSVASEFPIVDFAVTARAVGQHIVGYQCADIIDQSEVGEVLCGTRQHARVVYGAEALGAWELMAPMSLVQRGTGPDPVTLGAFMPADVIAFEHERELGPNRQPFGMSLRNEAREMQPVVVAPQAGDRARMEPGDTFRYAFGIYARPGTVSDAYQELARSEYGYGAYRHNVYNTSLTDTVFNIIDLIKVTPDERPDGQFVPSPSGWWERAKSFCDPEHDQAVRTSTASVLLGAALLTADDDLYRRRARPLVEFHLSRENHAWTPVKGKVTQGSTSYWRIGDTPGDASTLVPLYQQSQGRNAGIHALAMREIRRRRPKGSRTPMSTPLQAYQLTGNPAYLAEARAEARRYVRNEIDPPYTENAAENGFQYNYAKAWTELLLIHELTGDDDLLQAAHAEARRFITQTQVRPVPDTSVRVPNQPFIDNQADLWEDSVGIWDYPATEVPTEKIPAWLVSTNGVTFEQLTTYKVTEREDPGGGFSMIPVWAPFLLRLAERTGDDLLRDVARNLVVGRYTNYPGYYNRQHIATHMKPDFPYQGPPGVSSIFYSHIPAQLGMTIDYLVSESVTRSGGEIDFPAEFETNYVFFRFGLYGHRPGTFYGGDGVWPYLREGAVTLTNPQINWLAGVGDGTFYLSLTNASAEEQRVTVVFDEELTGVSRRPPSSRDDAIDVEVIRDNGEREPGSLAGGRLRTTVSAHGITAVIVRGVDLEIPGHGAEALPYRGSSGFHFDEENEHGVVRAFLLARPGLSGYDAYVQIATEDPAVLSYRVGDSGEMTELDREFYPYEWTVPVDDVAASFTYQITVNGQAVFDEPVILALSPAVTGVCPPGSAACGQLASTPDTTGGDTLRVTVQVRNGSDDELTGVTVDLGLPEGWEAEPAGDLPDSIAPGDAARWELDVTVPAGAAPRTETLTGTAGWDGGTVDLEPADVEVLVPLKLTEAKLEPDELTGPGDSTELSVSLLNHGPVERQGELELVVPSGWEASATRRPYTVDGREEEDYTFTLTAPASAQPDTSHRVAVRLDDGQEIAAAVRIASTDVVVLSSDPWPSYIETGWWASSGLRGWNGTSSRYSQEERVSGTATWTPELPEAGRYLVAVWFPANADTTTEARYVVHHAGGDDELTINQRDNPGQWYELGTFDFDAGSDGWVRLHVDNTDFHRTNAALFRPVETAPHVLSNVEVTPVSGPGGTANLTAVLTASSDGPASGCAAVAAPAGWEASPESVPVDLAAGESQELSFTVEVPDDAAADARYELRVDAVGVSRSVVLVLGTLVDEEVIGPQDDGYIEQGNWVASSLSGYDGGPTRYTGGTSGAVATWRPSLTTGRYRVSVWYPTNASTTEEATYTVVDADGEATLIVDQTADANAWRELGLFDLDEQTAAVRLTSIRNGFHRADSARFEPVTGAAAERTC